MEKIIVKADKEQAELAINQVASIAARLNEILTDLNDETGYQPNLEILQSFIIKKNDGPFLKGINTAIEKGMDSANIKVKLLRDNVKAGQSIFTESVLQLMKEACNQPGRRYLEHLSMKDGKLVITDESKKSIEESFTTYIQTEKGKKFFDLHNEAAAKLTELAQFIHQNTEVHFLIPLQFYALLFEQDEKNNISPRFIEHEALLHD